MMNVQSLTQPEEAILSTLVYFDLFEYPLTPFEAWKWLRWDAKLPAPSFAEISNILQSSVALRERCEYREGFIFLRGRTHIVGVRKERYRIADRKYQRVLRAVRVFRCVPFIKAIAVCNSLGLSNAREESDCDLLIITDPERIWAVRMFTTGIAALFGWRPKPGKTRDAVCLSYFLAGTRTLLPAIDDDIHLSYWLDHLVPVYGDVRAFGDVRATNREVQKFLPNAFGYQTTKRRTVRDTWLTTFVRAGIRALHTGAMQGASERVYRAIQFRILPQQLRSRLGTGSAVVMNDTMLKFHEHDSREAVAAMHRERCHVLLS